MLANSHFSSWKQAPVSKALFSASGLISLISFLFRHPLPLEIPIHQNQALRFLSFHLYFPFGTKMIISFWMLYLFRVVERRMGSRKFAMFGFMATIFSTLMEIFWVYVISKSPSGLTGLNGLIFACLYQFYSSFPSIVQSDSSIVSDKSRIYILAAILFIANDNHRTPLFGILFSFLYNLYFRDYLMPSWIVRIGNRFILPLLESETQNSAYRFRNIAGGSAAAAAAVAARNNAARRVTDDSQQGYTDQLIGGDEFSWNFTSHFGANLRPIPAPTASQTAAQQTAAHPQAQAQAQAQAQQAQQAARPVVLRDEDIKSLMNLGFDHSPVVAALQRAKNDVSLASNFLLDGANN